MAKRDPAKTARNRRARELSDEMDKLLPEVLRATGFADIHSLNAKIGFRCQHYVNVKERCIKSSDEYLSLYLSGLARSIRSIDPDDRQESTEYILGTLYQQDENVRLYVDKFIERTFLRHYDELNRVKPRDAEARIWIGENKAMYGLFVTPRFNEWLGEWENDRSEIRRFRPDYYTVGHLLETGLVVPDESDRIRFSDLDDLLGFYRHSLVRLAGSSHQDAIAKRYADFVRNAGDPHGVPFLIPEFRYRGREKKHKYRLDFCVIDPFSLAKIGFELSPWSTHGRLTGTKSKTVEAVNAEARGNFEKEVAKFRAFFVDFGIQVLVFTDTDLADPDKVFRQMTPYLRPEKRAEQLLLHSKAVFMQLDFDS